MWNQIENDWRPYDYIKKEIPDYIGELSRNQSAFLSGCLRKCKPKKILEVGTSGGGTTSLILKSMDMIGGDCDIYSVDLFERWYRDESKKNGWFVEQYKEKLCSSVNNTVSVFRGNIIGKFIEEIGNDIDFLFLDAAHSTPGELLDFIMVFPYLKTNAVVVVHDIALTHKYSDYDTTANALLFSAVVGEKFINKDEESFCKDGIYPNIGAFITNEETYSNISNVFLSLFVKWAYIPKEEHIGIVRDIVSSQYEREHLFLLDQAIKLNMHSAALNHGRPVIKKIRSLFHQD